MSVSHRWILNPVEWALSRVVAILKGKYDIRNCNSYRPVKLHEHAMEVMELVLEKRLPRIVTVNIMQFGSMPESVTIHAVSILRRLQEECCAKGRVGYVSCGSRESSSRQSTEESVGMGNEDYQKFGLGGESV